MRTYAEARGDKPFDWNAFLDRDDISNQEWIAALNLAGSWVTCACGNQCDVIPRKGVHDFAAGRPIDWQLSDLGYKFYTHIKRRNVSIAKDTLAQIEARSAALINEIISKKEKP